MAAFRLHRPSAVMAGLVRRFFVNGLRVRPGVDGRDKPSHDAERGTGA